MAACQVQLKADDRLSTVRCGRDGALPVRLTCPRLGHVENVLICQRCLGVIKYCSPCYEADRLLVRQTMIITHQRSH